MFAAKKIVKEKGAEPEPFELDVAQALYSWRLAAPKELASLGTPKSHGKWFYTLAGQLQEKEPRRKVVVTKLTRTFRFGAAISSVANGVLTIKEYSDQTEEDLIACN